MKILVQASMEAQQIAECDLQYGNLLMELIQKSYEDYNNDTELQHKLNNVTKLKNINNINKIKTASIYEFTKMFKPGI
ncbi:MAG: hypothetical protein KID00_02550 [Clostridium argentinense]|uniref:Uncharacterized protein n=1 Tax=Clostridium faecium TaxID=2762223 RepID=A0ABR8YSA6_9CLOT|nr:MULTISPECIES: hypothetical protein [Clostridium]MBD8047143.1 hypothetical protein [Clostridium faecium]MBS5822734.1 hypothetical protein [Clostridium argentinense]MDU1351086.1 hypothetical protein [Clostridium argentinense]